MFDFGTESKKKMYVALIDISSGSVGVGIVTTPPGDNLPIVLFTHRISMRITKYDAIKFDDLRRVREALLSACLILSQEGYEVLKAYDQHAKISDILVTCSAPWSHTYSQSVQYENDIRFKVSNSIIEDLVKSAIDEIANSLKDSVLFSVHGFETVEQITTEIKVNDYPVKNPIGLSGTIVGLSHTIGIVPTEIVTTVNEVQEKLFNTASYHIHTYIFTLFRVVLDIFKRDDSLCIINISDESTEFGIIENSLLHENKYVSYGSNTFIREIISKTNKPKGDVIASLHAYSESSHISNSDIDDFIEIYATRISETLTSLFTKRLAPNDIFITTNSVNQVLFKHIIAKAFKKISKTEKHIILLEKNLIEQTVSGTVDDIYLSISARFFHTSRQLNNKQ